MDEEFDRISDELDRQDVVKHLIDYRIRSLENIDSDSLTIINIQFIVLSVSLSAFLYVTSAETEYSIDDELVVWGAAASVAAASASVMLYYLSRKKANRLANLYRYFVLNEQESYGKFGKSMVERLDKMSLTTSITPYFHKLDEISSGLDKHATKRSNSEMILKEYDSSMSPERTYRLGSFVCLSGTIVGISMLLFGFSRAFLSESYLIFVFAFILFALTGAVMWLVLTMYLEVIERISDVYFRLMEYFLIVLKISGLKGWRTLYPYSKENTVLVVCLILYIAGMGITIRYGPIVDYFEYPLLILVALCGIVYSILNY